MTRTVVVVAAILSVLMVLLVAEMQISEVTKANPINYGPPIVTILQPNLGETYNSSIIPLSVQIQVFGYTYTDLELLSWVKYSIDDNPPIPLEVVMPYQFAPGYIVNTNTTLTNLSDGKHSISVYLQTSYHESAIANASFIIDATKPTPSLTPTITPTLNPTPNPSHAPTPITSFYGGGYGTPTSYVNYCSFYITICSPDDQTAYVNTMPLRFNITWTEYPRFPFSDIPPALNGYYAYSIDDDPFVQVTSNQSANDVFYQRPANNFTINPSFSYSVDISHLQKGYHKIAINTSLYHSTVYPPDHLYFNMTTAPYTFLVEEPTTTPTQQPTREPSPSPTIPEFPLWVVPPLLTAASAFLFFRRKHVK
jgi:hypothetical protein